MSNDKTPFTDGHIDVYQGLGRNKDEWRGRVSVQVKGRTSSTKRKAATTFSVARTDLLAFQKDGGVLYFYVAVNERGKCAPYYAILSPFTIAHYLQQAAPEQKSISIPFKKFPSVPDQIERIIGLALKTRNQSPAAGFDPALFKTMKSITVYSASGFSLDAPLRLDPGETDFALEIVTEGGMTLPLDGGLDIVPQAYMEQKTDTTISAGGGTFERVVVRRIDPETVEVRLDAGVVVTMKDTASQRMWNIAYSAQSNLAARIKATRFLLGVVEHGEVEINGETTALGATTADAVRLADELRGHLEAIRPLVELFEYLGVDTGLIELDEIDDEQRQNLGILHRLLIGGEEWRDEAGEMARGTMKVGRWELMLLVVPGSAPDLWRYVDPLAPSAPHMYRWNSDGGTVEKAFPATAYDVIEPEYLPRIVNLRLDSIVEAYEAIADSGQTTNLANHRVLALIKAADASDVRRDEFLGAAEALNEWIIAREGETPVHLINRWQISWRRNELTDADLAAVRALRRNAMKSKEERAEEIELACLLLAGDREEADYVISHLGEDTLRTVRDWPIWRLRENGQPSSERASAADSGAIA